MLVDVAVAPACFGIEAELAAGAGVGERGGELGSESVEIGSGEVSAERQQLAAADGDEEEAVEEAVGELGGVEVAQQFVFGDVRDDPDVR